MELSFISFYSKFFQQIYFVVKIHPKMDDREGGDVKHE